jgi:hypothetical protein
MNYYLKSILHSFTVWVLAALSNAILSACCLSVAPNEFDHWGEAFILAFFFTLVFSIPAVFVFWVAYMTNKMVDGNSLFRVLLRTGFITAAISGILFFVSFKVMFKGFTFFLMLSIIVAAISSIMLHHNFIINNHKNKISNNE